MNIADVRTSVFWDVDGWASGQIMPALMEFSSADVLNQFVACNSALVGNIPFEIPAPSPLLSVVDNGFDSLGATDRNWIQAVWTSEAASNDGGFGCVELQPFTAVPFEGLSHGIYSKLLLPDVDWVVSPNGEPVVLETSNAEFSHELVQAVSTLASYVERFETYARDLRDRIRRKSILSSCVSKNGHVPVLAIESRVRVETAARDQVLHLEVITLAEEHEEAPGSSILGQIVTFGEGLCKRTKRSFWNLFSGCSESACCCGSISVGPSAAVA